MGTRKHSFAGEPVTVDLVLTHHWFDEVEAGRKDTEYRAMTPKWTRLIWDCRARLVSARFRWGYSKRAIVRPVFYVDVGPCPYPGWPGEYYRIHFEKTEAANG